MATWATTDTMVWRKSSYSGTGGGECVEVATASAAVAMRDSKAPEGTVLWFPTEEWAGFLTAAQGGEL